MLMMLKMMTLNHVGGKDQLMLGAKRCAIQGILGKHHFQLLTFLDMQLLLDVISGALGVVVGFGRRKLRIGKLW